MGRKRKDKEIKQEERVVKALLEEIDSRAYRGNSLLKRAGEIVPFTKEHIKEYAKCADDPVYFAEQYIKIVHVDKGLIPIQLYPYQKKLIKAFHENRFSIVLACRQSGKCHTINTIVTLRHSSYNNGEEFDITIGDFFAWQIYRRMFHDLSMNLLTEEQFMNLLVPKEELVKHIVS